MGPELVKVLVIGAAGMIGRKLTGRVRHTILRGQPVVIDGEHYPAVIHSALDGVVSDGHEIAAAVLVGGKEKLPAGGLDELGSWEVVTGSDQQATLDAGVVRGKALRILGHANAATPPETARTIITALRARGPILPISG